MADYNERRVIEEFPNYVVDGYGNVYSLPHTTKASNGKNIRIKGQKLKPRRSPNGYLYVSLYAAGAKQPKSRFVHRLVAKSFVPNPDGLPSVNHKDENKDNNRIDNLEWCTHEYNNSYATANERRSKTLMGRIPGNRKAVMGKTIEDPEWQFFLSRRLAANAFKARESSVTLVCQGVLRQTNGCVFRYATPSEVKKFGEYTQE